jgi:hypothetical protein
MPGRNGPRFALEAGFLILLAVLAGIADLRWQTIVLVMAIAWVLIALLEWAFWREGPRLPTVPRGYASWAPEAPPALPPQRREDETRVIRADELPAPDPELEPEPEPEPAPEPEPEPELDPAEEPVAEGKPEEPAPKRPWWWRRREPDSVTEQEPPRHVRVLPPERTEEHE